MYEASCILTGAVDAQGVTAEAEDLSAERVDGRLRQTLLFANVLTELVDDILEVLQHSHSRPSQLTCICMV